MKRTTVMVEEDILYELQQIAQRQGTSTSGVIREALAQYVAAQHEAHPPGNPLLALVGLGESDEPTDVADGGDEEMLREGSHPVRGWSVSDDRAG